MFSVKTVVLLLIIKCSVTLGDDCSTPDNKTGHCLSVTNCSAIIDFIVTIPKPFTTEVKDLLKKYVCSYEGDHRNTKVCCPSQPINLREDYKDDGTPPLQPNVTGHVNIDLLPEDCGLVDTEDKIRGGRSADLREFPWMALLTYEDNNSITCSGTIINENYILTAAHCVVGTLVPPVGVCVGEYDLSSDMDCEPENPNNCLLPPQDLKVEEIISHPKYNNVIYSDDIALIRVSKIKLVKANVQAVCLPVYEDIVPQEYKRGVVTGWGFTDGEGKKKADKLQKVELEKRDLSYCIKKYQVQPSIKLSYKQICVGGKGVQNSCRGDSGGPFHVAAHFNGADRYVQRGVVSLGHRFCGTDRFPGVYTNVAYYTNWILDNLKP